MAAKTKPKITLKLKKGELIRRGKQEDILAIRPYLMDSWVTHARHEPKLLDEKRMRKSDIAGYYKAALKNKDCNFLVAEVNGEIAGFIRADVQKIASFFKDNEILYIDDVYVVKKFRRCGIARSLIFVVENIAKRKNIKRLQARVYTFNKPMQKLLGSMGYSAPHATWDKVL